MSLPQPPAPPPEPPPAPRHGRPPGKAAPRAARSALPLLFLLGALELSCSVERHYRTLSFFFDGVPDPNAPPSEPARPGESVDWAAMSAVDRAAMLGRRVKAAEVYYHPPYKEQRCHECHALSRARDTGSITSWAADIPTLVAPIEDLCLTCHEVPRTRYVHGPAGSGRCYVCHEHHLSRYPKLRRQEPMAPLCTSCHTAELFVTAQQHQVWSDTDCFACHDPHGSELPALMRPDAPEHTLPAGPGGEEE